MRPSLILLFTADADVEQRLEEALHGSSVVVLVARNLRDALEIILAKGRALDCAIVDIDQEFGGITLLGALGAYRDRVAVIVIAASAKYAELATAGRESMTFLEKPVPAEVLVAALASPREQRPPPVAASF
jgi:DNA-binding NtrC family response regulator